MPTATHHNTDAMITFEHPVNEQVRVYLRLEHLFAELTHNLAKIDHASSKLAMAALLKIINVTDRPDLKSKLIQTLSWHTTQLGQLKQSPGVDGNMLDNVLQKLDEAMNHLHQYSGKIGDTLRQNEFLNQIRTHLRNPAGACEHALPAYQLWLAKSSDERQQDLIFWRKIFMPLHDAITLLLDLIRKSTPQQQLIANGGLYRQSQDPNTPCALLRMRLPKDSGVFPEFSASKHHLNIRFLQPDIYQGGKPIQTKNDISFYLTCCRL